MSFFVCEFIPQMLGTKYSMNNKTSDIDIGFQPKYQKVKQPVPGSYLYLRLKMGDLASKNLQNETENEYEITIWCCQ